MEKLENSNIDAPLEFYPYKEYNQPRDQLTQEIQIQLVHKEFELELDHLKIAQTSSSSAKHGKYDIETIEKN